MDNLMNSLTVNTVMNSGVVNKVMNLWTMITVKYSWKIDTVMNSWIMKTPMNSWEMHGQGQTKPVNRSQFWHLLVAVVSHCPQISECNWVSSPGGIWCQNVGTWTWAAYWLVPWWARYSPDFSNLLEVDVASADRPWPLRSPYQEYWSSSHAGSLVKEGATDMNWPPYRACGFLILEIVFKDKTKHLASGERFLFLYIAGTRGDEAVWCSDQPPITGCQYVAISHK